MRPWRSRRLSWHATPSRWRLTSSRRQPFRPKSKPWKKRYVLATTFYALLSTHTSGSAFEAARCTISIRHQNRNERKGLRFSAFDVVASLAMYQAAQTNRLHANSMPKCAFFSFFLCGSASLALKTVEKDTQLMSCPY